MIIFKLLLNNPAALQYLRGSPNTTDSYDVVRKNVNLFHKAGLPILAGTDAVGKIPVIDIPHGLSLHWELENLVEAGMTPVEALRAATVVPAQRHAFHDRGIIEPGKRADLILLDENPLVNISNTRSIVKVWVGGMEFTS